MDTWDLGQTMGLTKVDRDIGNLLGYIGGREPACFLTSSDNYPQRYTTRLSRPILKVRKCPGLSQASISCFIDFRSYKSTHVCLRFH